MSGAVAVEGTEHIGILVKDTTSLAEWYQNIFGARVLSMSEANPPIIFLGFGAGSLIELIPGEGSESQFSDHIHVSFAVKSLDAALDALEKLGIPLGKQPFKAYEGSPVAFLRDPEGNIIQLVERVSDLPRPR